MNHYEDDAPAVNPTPADGELLLERKQDGGPTADLAQRFQEGLDYLRELEPEEIRDELESRIRTRPLLSVAIAATAGFLLGRLLRH